MSPCARGKPFDRVPHLGLIGNAALPNRSLQKCRSAEVLRPSCLAWQPGNKTPPPQLSPHPLSPHHPQRPSHHIFPFTLLSVSSCSPLSELTFA
ncbi:hypothetical protein AUP68_17773 [Ilyonectria robusta]